MNLSRFCSRISYRLASAVLVAAALFAVPTSAEAKSTTPVSAQTVSAPATVSQSNAPTPMPEQINAEETTSHIVKTANKKKKRTRKPAVRPIAPPASTIQAHEYNEDDPNAYNRERADDLLMNAMSLIGISYRWGGTKPATGLDCSGFIQYVFRQAWGVNLPRTSSEMAKVGTPVNKSDLQPGDLVFFSRFGRRVGHVGMYIGNDKFIHAPSTGKKIQIANLNKPYYVKHYVGARRISERTPMY